MELLRVTPDKAFDLAIVDPPYGIGEDGGKFRDRKGGGHRVLAKKNWDNEKPGIDYFKELFRVSKNQIIWGGNYFANLLPASRCWLFWDKLMGGDFSDGELAWTSFDSVVKRYTKCNKDRGHIHPTQKPVSLYSWIISIYCKPGDRILDTHLGSMSIAVACHFSGLHLTGAEKDKDYFLEAVERVKRETMQQEFIF
jgi:site-specific DNA-methyltransferase (adenine-specific)